MPIVDFDPNWATWQRADSLFSRFEDHMKAKVGWSRPVGWRQCPEGWRPVWRVPAPSRRI